MILALLFRTLFILISISLIAVAFIVYNKAYHLKGQRYVFGVLLLFGLAFFFETLRYMMPIDSSYYLQYWLVGSLLISGLCVTAHYIQIIIKRHSLLKIRFVPQIFYVSLFLYLGVIGPIDLVNHAPFEEVNGWHIQETMGFRSFIYVLMLYGFATVIYYKLVGNMHPRKKEKIYIQIIYTVL